ncbi:hypothetical protein K8U54_05990 [Pseudomonas fulva]|uniref:hypothetical protein n=1 Tax=Pseudomonas fulva TaxID=47880 RepID=UPI00201E1C0A|nr:hypothetical protein [Pseudomonas fulva]UQY36034.1 hypothetical protein K8U54_05990 [Pseudomonas fulva]
MATDINTTVGWMTLFSSTMTAPRGTDKASSTPQTTSVAWVEQRDTQIALSRVSLRSTRATPKSDIHEVRA